MISVQAVSKAYARTLALSDVSLEVGRGSVTGLIGPNGSGKTTLLRIICSLIKADRGRVTVGGDDVTAKPRQVRRRLGFMPAETVVPADLNIGEYMDYFACLADIESICTHICILEEGRVRLCDDLSRLREQLATPCRRLLLRVPAENLDRACRLLAGLPAVSACGVADGQLQVDVADPRHQPVLRALLEADIELLELHRETRNLERIFLESTEGVVS